jgi:hypothetical protein
MTHYISEQIAISENLTGDEKTEAERRCFETILKLWEHRSSFPNGRYPFKGFESVFSTLEQLDIKKSRFRYFRSSPIENNVQDVNSKTQINEVESWLNLALSFDSTAKIMIDLVLKQAAYYAADEKTADWIKTSMGISKAQGLDLPIIKRLLEITDEEDSEEEICSKKHHELESMIEELDWFVDLSRLLRENLEQNLRSISINEDSCSDL